MLRLFSDGSICLGNLMPQIHVENLVKTFKVAERSPGILGALRGVVRRRHRTVTALDRISFSLEQGELLGYIGPNGAGKSTTVKTLSGILVPDSGRVEVLGRVPWKDQIVLLGRDTDLEALIAIDIREAAAAYEPQGGPWIIP